MDISKGPRVEPEENSSSNVSEFANGTGASLAQLRLHSMLTKENVSWLILIALAGEVFGISDRVLALAAGAC